MLRKMKDDMTEGIKPRARKEVERYRKDCNGWGVS